LLPEEYNREIIAKNLGITARNDFAMLREIGGECAGAITLLDLSDSTEKSRQSYEPISEDELIKILDQLPQGSSPQGTNIRHTIERSGAYSNYCLDFRLGCLRAGIPTMFVR
jgi:hypothetical protein